MGILDELRDEAERKKILEQQEVLTEEKIAEKYQQSVLPKMQAIFNFFKEIVEYLQFIQEPIKVTNYTKKYPEMNDLVQLDYKLSTDKHGGMSHYNKLMNVNIRFYCIGEESFDMEVKNQAEIEQHINFLTAKKVPFEWSRQQNNVVGSFARFTIEKKVPVKINFQVDYPNSKINLEIANHYDFGHIKRSYTPEEINDDFLDQLAKFLLRKDNSFVEIEMSEQAREALRENLRKNLDFDTNPIYNENIEEEKKDGLIGKLSSLFK